MADFNLSYKNMLNLEFDAPKNALHRNKSENGLTFMGIYESANPEFCGWQKIYCTLKTCGQMEKASEILYNDEELRLKVEKFYKNKFWDEMKLDFVLPYRTADLMFKFAVNVGTKRAVKFAQRIVGVRTDGIVGKNTLKALNGYNPVKFENEYKAAFKKFYNDLAAKKDRHKIFLNGWLNRVKLSQAGLDFIHLA